MSDPRRHRPVRRLPAPDEFAAHDVIATLSDMSAARRAVQSLQMAGIDASQVTLFGPAAERAAAQTDVRHADLRFTRLMMRRSWIGAGIGAIIGVVVGAIGAAIVLRGSGPAAAGVFWAAVVGTGVLGLGTGAAAGATSAAQMSTAWELTFHEAGPGAVGVAVHTDDPREADRAYRVLGRCSPTQLEHLG